MNEAHLEFCASPEWAKIVRNDVLPWAVGKRGLGDDVLEVGPGPGLTTDILRTLVPQLTAVEIDTELSKALAARMAGTNVEVVTADGANLPLPDDRFSAATAFTMLHHVPTNAEQDKILAELCRVLRPGGLLVGSDVVKGVEIDAFHEGDIFNPCDPDTFAGRLRAAGFTKIEVEATDHGDEEFAWARNRFRFAATAP